uniref:Uncharacterized protein n=1 Tax=Rhizophora mucronata TaxID=61149 RepID=A0A2P2QYQ8_RHIMU
MCYRICNIVCRSLFFDLFSFLDDSQIIVSLMNYVGNDTLVASDS